MDGKMRLARTGVIHGRFQILHKDHLKYLMAGKALCRYLVVGITRPDPFLNKDEIADPARSDPLANPLTYYERHMMLDAVLREAGFQSREFMIVPFPINLPERYEYYVPMDAVFFLSIYDDWGRRKLRYLKSMGLRTHLLWEVPPEKKGISAAEVRRLIVNDQPWEHLVPACVPPLLNRWDVPRRLKGLQ
jgi:nicotinamide-nucleotide adenylyltransferase